jgi:uncharacterized OB-fold protein
LTAAQVSLVDYLELDGQPRLVARECTECGARYFERRNACAKCGGTEFGRADVATTGELVSFTIVPRSAPGVPTPFVAAIVDCGGTTVRGVLTGVEADPEHVRLGMPLRLTTVPLGADRAGTEAIGYAFMPPSPPSPACPTERTTDGE